MKRWIALFVIALGFFLTGMGVMPQQTQLLRQSRWSELEHLMRSVIKDPAAASFADLFHLCLAYSRLKRYSEVFPCTDHLQMKIERGDNKLYGFDWSAGPATMRAEAYIEFGDYARALVEAKKAYSLVQGRNAWLQARMYAITALALAHVYSGNREEPLRLVAELDGISFGFLMSMADIVSDKFNGLAKIYIALGQYGRALEAIKKDPGLRRGDFFGVSFTYWAIPRDFMLNKALLETGDVAAAKAGYDKLLEMPQTRDNGELYWLILFDRGRIAEKEGNRMEAIEFYKRAVEVIEQQRSTINTEANKIGFVGDKQNVYRYLISALFSEGKHATAFEYVERSKSRALVDMLARKQDFAVQSGNAEQVRALLAITESAEAESRTQNEVEQIASQRRSLVIKAREQLREQAPELASLVSVTYLSAAEIQAGIPQDEALVEYYYNDKDMFAFVLTTHGLQAVRLNSDGLETDVRQLRKALEDPKSDRHVELSQRLYARLIKPLEGFLSKRNLIIVAHGALHYLPFNALHDGANYLVERFSIRLLPSASLLKYLRARKPDKPARMLAFGNPDLGDPRFDLVHAQAEAEAVTRLLPQSRALIRKQATETAFKQFGGGFNYIHIASHGEFDSEAPLRSALLLAKDVENDGVLTVSELYSLRLDADLVTLSACETGLGKITNGDDVVGLTRGFLYAGSSSIVASLWKVDDLATSDLMTKFYSNLKEGDKRVALRQAQLDTKVKYQHPFFWAAFQLTGNAQ